MKSCLLCQDPTLKWTDVVLKINEIKKAGKFACSHTLLCPKHIQVFQEESFGTTPTSFKQVIDQLPQKISEIQKRASEIKAKAWRDGLR